MAFENIGIGGILTFEARGAVANMTMAQRAFNALGQSAARVQAGVAKVGAGLGGMFGGLTMVGGAAIAGVGYGISKWVRSGMDFNKEMETSELAIATILATVKKTPLSQEMLVAKQAMIDLNKVAAEAPGELSDIVSIFQLMTGPMTVGKAEMNDIFKATKGTAILAGVLKRSFHDTGQAMSKLTAGQVELGNDIHMMLKSMGLLTESTAEWKAMLPEQRVKRVMEMLSTFEESGERVGKTWEAVSSTTTSILKQLAGTFTRKMFDNASLGLTSFNDLFFKNQKEWMAKAAEFGESFGNALKFITKTIKGFVDYAAGQIGKIQRLFDKLGHVIDRSVLERVAEVGLQFGITAVAVSPLITIVSFLGSKVMSLISIISGAGSILMGVLAPLMPVLLALGGLFLLFRKDGESAMDTFTRGFAYLKDFGERFMGYIKPGITALMNAFVTLRETLASFWEHARPGIEQLTLALQGLFELAAKMTAHFFNMFAKMAEFGARIWKAIEPGVSAVFNALMKAFRALVDAFNYIFPKIQSVLEPIFNVIMDIFVALGEVVGKLMEMLAPVIDMLTWIFENLLVPIAGFVVDTFGPVVVKAFEAIGWVIEKVLGLLGKVIDGIKYLADKVKGIVDWIVGGDWENMPGVIGEAARKMRQEQQALNASINQTVDNMAFQMGLAKLAAMGANEVVMMVAQGLQELYHDTLKPIVDTGLKVLNSFVGDAEIKTKQPDVKVDVNVNNKSTMCVNGRNLAVAQGQYETEVSERSGFNRTPWQTQRVQITGVKP